MTDSDHQHRGYHDLGGNDGGNIDKSEHVLEPWEKRVDAVRGLLGDRKRKVMRADGLRNAIETMGEDLYLALSYYERWMAAITRVVEANGVVTREELLARMDDIKRRLELDDVEARPMPPVEGER